MVVGESLQSGVFNIGQSPEAWANFVTLVVAARSCRQRWRNPSDAKNRVAHPRPTRLIAENLNPINEPANFIILRQTRLHCMRKVELRGHIVLQNVRKRGGRFRIRKSWKVNGDETSIHRESPSWKSFPVTLNWKPAFLVMKIIQLDIVE